MMAERLRVVLAQINPVVGDMDGNLSLMLEAVEEAVRVHDAGLVLFPELTLTGYPPEDLLRYPTFLEQVDQAEKMLLRRMPPDVALLYGLPRNEAGGLLNLARFAVNGRVEASYTKRLLPNYSVFDEKRWFVPGSDPRVVDYAGFRLGLTVCEDLWEPGPMTDTAAAGAEVVLNISASPFALGKPEERLRTFRRRVDEGGVPVITCNLVGGQDELVFDGAGFALDRKGDVVARAPEYESALTPLDLVRSGDEVMLSDGECASWLSDAGAQYQGAVLATRDYLRKNRAPGALIGLSGGIDSALTLAVAVDALGPEQVTAVMMGSRYTRDISYRLAREQAELLGVRYIELPIDESVGPLSESLATGLGEPVSGVAAENLQARLRGLKLMALSNQMGQMVLATGNKSELAVGYATLYGDMVGAFAPLRDLSKTRVYALARWRNEQGVAIPQGVIDRPPSAELRSDQYDSDSLPDYGELDRIIEAFVEEDRSPDSIVADGFDRETVDRVLGMIQRNEYKRRQGAPGPRLSRRAFGRDRRYPITSGFRPGGAS